ncbi:MAG: amino acid adenylation domain-containing protein, partial [Chloroflexi bacterium]|nr:amino acid adenylation domain-containing protein [Chloroflexota bacterium]
LLDAQLQPVPRGVAGELYIGGAQLARGYHDRPALTATQFVPDPFSVQPGSRLYRTGDLARYRADGQIEFLGRIDRQVKLRGFRIELGEIEATLLRHSAVEQSVVLVYTDQSGGQRLIGYVAKRQAAPSDETLRAELRSLLQRDLPAYMVPATLLVLDTMPLTPNGKIDRRALPVPDRNDTDREQRFVAPRTPTEELIANVWAEVLGVSALSVDDNFFERGGHSLLATQAVTRLRNVLGLDLPLRLIFEAPTVAAFATQLAQYRPTAAQPIVAAPRDNSPLPLSFAQQRLWFLDQLQRGSMAYSIPAVVRLSGRLDVPSLARSLNLIVQRHEVLRTTFAAHNNEPVQRIAPEIELALPVIEIKAEAEIESLIYAEIQRPFDLQEGPLLRVTLLRRSETEQILVFVIHHSVFDGWSQSVLLRELVAFYQAITQQEPIEIAPLPLQYADYALWQRQWLQGAVLEAQLDYWRQQLAGIEPLELPTDHPRPPVSSERGAHLSFELPDQLRVELQQLSQRSGATLFMTLLAAWQLLLSRYTRQLDIAVGTPIAGRVQPELEGLIGFFVNTLVLRTDLSGNLSFLELIERVRTTALGAYAHQDLPFEMLVETIQPERDLNHHPLFQVMFALQNTPRATIELPELTLEPLVLERHTTKFDLTLTFNETAEGLRGTIDYRSELFEAETIAHMADQLQVLLAAIVADPARRIDRLPLLTGDDAQLLHDWNATTHAFDTAPTLQQLVAAQAARTPEALAVVSAEQQLTYRDLDQRATQLAHYLRRLGVGPEDIVALLLPRCADYIVAALAALKADAAYLPLDAAYPPERLQFMLDDARAVVLLTHTDLAALVPAFAGPLVALDRAGPLLDQQPTTPLPTCATADHLAYIIYTSGSTGQPKGVAVPQRGVTNLVAWHRHTYTLTECDRTSLLAGLAFDAAVWELWPTLASGASLHLPPDALRAAPDALIEWMHAQQLTVAFLPTPLAEAILAEPAAATLTLRALLTGGDQLHAHDLSGLPFALVNHYGPTENSVVATCAVVAPDATTLPPIGRPIANTTVYLLDAQLQPVPRGVAGEICIGGVQLARGYHDRPALTAEKFVPDPFSAGYPQGAGSRLYRTGDLARYRADGNIEFLGRIDHQVKLRGFRIELGEIEAVLRQHPDVREAVVIVHAESSGTKRLVAYVVGEQGNKRTNEQSTENHPSPVATGEGPGVRAISEGLAALLRAFVGERLPEYMVPSVIIPLDALPLTPNGKVDRRALPAPDASRSEHEPTFVGPRTTTEELIARVWSSVLDVQPIGIHDNFFTLGGHSLLATQVISRLRQLLNLDLPLRLLFEAPTIAAFADRLANQQASELV